MTGRLLCGFRRSFDERRDFFGMREKYGMTAVKLDRLGLRPACHESLELGIDHPILLGDHHRSKAPAQRAPHIRRA
jgi:hypothetical protein